MFAVLPTGCRKSLIFQLVPKVCEYLHDHGFEYPKAVILVVVCPLSALIDSHIQELKDHGRSACSLTDQDILELGELLRRLSTTEVSLFFILRLFAPFHASLRHLQTCQLQKQTDPAKTGLVRYLVSKSHGSETYNCRVQRVFFFSLAWVTIAASPLTIAASLRKEKTLWHPG